ncbi:MAG: toxin-antitoxin system YwqK family antitoxin [Akkermansiaceae bacterium]
MRHLTLIFALLVPQLSSARIGESVEQCDKRYGELIETTADNRSRTYFKRGIRVECFFKAMPEGECIHIKYAPIKSQNLAKTLRESNHPRWRPITAGSINGVWRAESIETNGYDDMLVWYVEGDSLRIDTREYSASHPNMDDFDARKKVIAEAIDSGELELKDQDGGKIAYAPNSDIPHTGWVKGTSDDRGFSLWQYKDGKEHGLYISWHPNGKKHYEYNLKEGLDHGLVTCWYENGKKEYQANYREGIRHGLYSQWYESGQKRSESNLNDGVEHGLVTEWYESGKKKYQGNYKNGKEHGLYTEWRSNGKKWTETNYKDGLEHGRKTVWYANGKKEIEGNIVDGVEHGLVTKWYESGHKRSETNYKNGVEHGLYTSWYENGRKRYEYHLINGKEEGLVTKWNENGKKVYETIFRGGEQVE